MIFRTGSAVVGLASQLGHPATDSLVSLTSLRRTPLAMLCSFLEQGTLRSPWFPCTDSLVTLLTQTEWGAAGPWAAKISDVPRADHAVRTSSLCTVSRSGPTVIKPFFLRLPSQAHCGTRWQRRSRRCRRPAGRRRIGGYTNVVPARQRQFAESVLRAGTLTRC
jgi:hypothetical protein